MWSPSERKMPEIGEEYIRIGFARQFGLPRKN
jgi:hypothetical protein